MTQILGNLFYSLGKLDRAVAQDLGRHVSKQGRAFGNELAVLLVDRNRQCQPYVGQTGENSDLLEL